jgi:hypothetical protein
MDELRNQRIDIKPETPVSVLLRNKKKKLRTFLYLPQENALLPMSLYSMSKTKEISSKLTET